MDRVCPIMCLIVYLFFPLQAQTHDQNRADEKNNTLKVRQLPKHLVYDLYESFGGTQAVYFVSAAGGSLAFYPLDHTVSHYLSQHPLLSQSFDKTWGKATEPLIIAGGTIATWGLAILLQDDTLSRAMESSIESFVLSMTIATGLKYGVDRERPNGEDHSLPSGHTTAAFSTASVLTSFYGYQVGVPAFLLASLTALTRLDQNEHYLTDVLLGMTIGTTIGIGTAQYHKKSKERTAFLTPLIYEKGFGLIYYRFF